MSETKVDDARTLGNESTSDVEAGRQAAAPTSAGEEKDANVVDWDGPDDPANPRNWPARLKMANVVCISAFSLYANLAATMFAPGAASLVHEFHITDSFIAAFTVTIYVLGFSVGPLVLAPLSETYGRLWIYHISNIVYLGFTLGCALSTDAEMFLVFRMFCGCAASGFMTIGGGTIADLMPQEERGKAMAMYSIGPLIGPIIGPIVGGFVSQSIGWRWTFWIILILGGVFSGIGFLVLRETHATIILNHKAAKIRKETGSETPRDINANGSLSPAQVLGRAILRPTKMLIFSPIVLLLSLYVAFVFGLIFLLFTTFPSVFEATYGFGPGTAGLSYLGLGLGMATGVVLLGKLSDRLMKKPADGGAASPEQRLRLMIGLSPIVPVGFFWYGWAAERHAHWIVPILGTFFIGLGAFSLVVPAQIYFVDAFGSRASASALAASMVCRNLFGTFLPLAADPLYDRLGLGWGNSLLGFIGIFFIPVPLLFYRYGGWLREKFPVDY